jgi:hypothetical protein
MGQNFHDGLHARRRQFCADLPQNVRLREQVAQVSAFNDGGKIWIHRLNAKK